MDARNALVETHRARQLHHMKPDAVLAQDQLPDAAALIESLFNSASGSHPTIEKLLKWIAQRMEAFGCALWEIAEGSDIHAIPPRGHYFTAAAWVAANDFFAMHDAPIDGTTVGAVFVTQQPKRLDNMPTEGGIRRNHPFFVRHVERQLEIPSPLPHRELLPSGLLHFLLSFYRILAVSITHFADE